MQTKKERRFNAERSAKDCLKRIADLEAEISQNYQELEKVKSTQLIEKRCLRCL